jgi:hypothetical protein
MVRPALVLFQPGPGRVTGARIKWGDTYLRFIFDKSSAIQCCKVETDAKLVISWHPAIPDFGSGLERSGRGADHVTVILEVSIAHRSYLTISFARSEQILTGPFTLGFGLLGHASNPR